MKRIFLAITASSLLSCGSNKVTEPPAVINGTITFSLDQVECQDYATAEYWIDSIKVGTEPIVRGALSQGYTVASGRRVAKARVLKTGANVGLWTFNNSVTVPANGAVTVNLDC
jgi:hypothetical protein